MSQPERVIPAADVAGYGQEILDGLLARIHDALDANEAEAAAAADPSGAG